MQVFFAGRAYAENLCAKALADKTNTGPRWEQVWGDEFSADGQVNEANWFHEINEKTFNAEKQYYTKRDHNNSFVKDGILVIEGRKEDFNGRAYTSARLNSSRSWAYGRYEFRARATSAQGTWPAIWMLARKVVYGKDPWLDNGELDIMETSTKFPHLITHAMFSHADNIWDGRQKWKQTLLPSSDTEFHTYAMDWLPWGLKFYIDGVETYHDERLPQDTWQNWPFDQDMYLIINLAIGGTLGGPIGADALPARLEVDYVRVSRPTHQEDCLSPPESPVALKSSGAARKRIPASQVPVVPKLNRL